MKQRGNKGLTLIEVMIAAFVLAIIVVAIYSLIFRSSRAYSDGSKMGTLYENGRRALDEMANEVRLGNSASSIITTAYNGANKLDVPIFTRLEPDSIQPDPNLKNSLFETALTLRLEPSPVDANNNGNTGDDWKLVRTRVTTDVITAAVTTTTTNLCDYIKPGGLVFTKSGGNIIITLTLHVADDKNKIQERTVSTSVSLRNKP